MTHSKGDNILKILAEGKVEVIIPSVSEDEPLTNASLLIIALAMKVKNDPEWCMKLVNELQETIEGEAEDDKQMELPLGKEEATPS